MKSTPGMELDSATLLGSASGIMEFEVCTLAYQVNLRGERDGQSPRDTSAIVAYCAHARTVVFGIASCSMRYQYA